MSTPHQLAKRSHNVVTQRTVEIYGCRRLLTVTNSGQCEVRRSHETLADRAADLDLSARPPRPDTSQDSIDNRLGMLVAEGRRPQQVSVVEGAVEQVHSKI